MGFFCGDAFAGLAVKSPSSSSSSAGCTSESGGKRNNRVSWVGSWARRKGGERPCGPVVLPDCASWPTASSSCRQRAWPLAWPAAWLGLVIRGGGREEATSGRGRATSLGGHTHSATRQQRRSPATLRKRRGGGTVRASGEGWMGAWWDGKALGGGRGTSTGGGGRHDGLLRLRPAEEAPDVGLQVRVGMEATARPKPKKLISGCAGRRGRSAPSERNGKSSWWGNVGAPRSGAGVGGWILPPASRRQPRRYTPWDCARGCDARHTWTRFGGTLRGSRSPRITPRNGAKYFSSIPAQNHAAPQTRGCERDPQPKHFL